MQYSYLALSASVFCFQHLCHFLGRFLTSAGQPKLDYGIEPISEKFNMVFDVAVDVLLLRANVSILDKEDGKLYK